MPESDGTDAGTTVYSYNTADGTGPEQCRKPAWAGLVCSTTPKAQPATGKPLPVTQISGYNQFGQPTTSTETTGCHRAHQCGAL